MATVSQARLRSTGRPIVVVTRIVIARARADVFAYVTTPALWATWHPATVAVRDVPERPLREGETARELIAVAGRRSEALWTVTRCVLPEVWEIVTDTPDGAARIEYRFGDVAEGTRFERRLEFRSKRWPWRILDPVLTRWILVRQSARALANLKRALES